jgi:enoyl-CoA hydratase/carnithine racemase
LNRPPVNAVDQAMYRKMAALFADVDQVGADVRAVVLSGEGPHFCAGNDLDEFGTMTPENGQERMWRVREAFFAIAECSVPVPLHRAYRAWAGGSASRPAGGLPASIANCGGTE